MNADEALKKVKNIIRKKVGQTYVFNFNSRSSLYDFQSKLMEFVPSFTNVSDYCVPDDHIPELHNLVNACLKRDNTMVLRGLDLYLILKSQNDKKKLYQQLLQPSQYSDSPLIILAWASRFVLSDLIEDDIRRKNFIYFVEGENQDEGFSLTLVNSNLDCKGVLSDFKNYLKKHEVYPPEKEYVVKTSVSKELFPDSSVKITQLNSYKDLVKYTEPTVNFIDEDDSNTCWEQYYHEFGTDGLSAAYESCFKNRSMVDCLDDCRNDNFKKWLLISYQRGAPEIKNGVYFNNIIKKVKSVDDLNDCIVYGLLDFDCENEGFDEYYLERKKLVGHINYFPQEYADNVIGTKDPLKRIAYLSDKFPQEKYSIIKAIMDYGRVDESVMTLLKKSYPDLAAYLSEYSIRDFPDADYFDQYRKNKVLNNPPDSDMLDRVSHSYESYVRYTSRNKIFNEEIIQKDHIFFLDALGVEYIPYVMHLCDERGLRAECRVCKAELPTITPVNTTILEKYKDIKVDFKELDTYYHNTHKDIDSELYRDSSCYLVDVLELIKKAIDEIAGIVSADQNCILFSDHGSSRAFVLNGQADSIELPGTSAHHNGRCAEDCDIELENPHVKHVKGHYVVKDYFRIKGTGSIRADIESHGGCSLEEALVPLFIISIKSEGEAHTASIKNVNGNVLIDAITSSAILEIIYAVQTSELRLVVEGKEYTSVNNADFVYKFNLYGLNPGKYDGTIYNGSRLVTKVQFTIANKGMTRKKLF